MHALFSFLYNWHSYFSYCYNNNYIYKYKLNITDLFRLIKFLRNTFSIFFWRSKFVPPKRNHILNGWHSMTWNCSLHIRLVWLDLHLYIFGKYLSYILTSIQSNPIRFNPIQFNSIQSNPIRSDPDRSDPTRCDAMRSDSIRFDSIQFSSVQISSDSATTGWYVIVYKKDICFKPFLHTNWTSSVSDNGSTFLKAILIANSWFNGRCLS